jgi:hypothetical protein
MRMKINKNPCWKIFLVLVSLALFCCSFHVPRLRCEKPFNRKHAPYRPFYSTERDNREQQQLFLRSLVENNEEKNN